MRCLLKKNVTLSKEQTMADSLSEKARKAKNAATKDAAKYAAGDTVIRNAEAAGIKDLTTAEFKKARKTLQPRIRVDRQKTAARAAGIEKMQAKKTAAKRAAAAIGNTPASKKTAPKPAAKTRLKATTKKKGM
jgi:hypothetical protein